jgi:hypothetical protein
LVSPKIIRIFAVAKEGGMDVEHPF